MTLFGIYIYNKNLTGGPIMFFIKFFFIAAIGLFAIIASTCTTEQKPSPAMAGASSVSWVPVGENDWAVYKDVPNYHFALAKKYLQKGDYVQASAELKRGNSFLIFQNYRLLAATKKIKVLSDSVAAGQYNDINKLDAATAIAIRIIDDRYPMVPVLVKNTSALNIDNSYTMAPVEIKPDSVFEEEYNYHFDNAKSNLQNNDRDGAASEIIKAGSFLRLKAAAIGNIAKADLDSAGNELVELASKVKAGSIKDLHELDRVFQNTKRVDSKKKE
jgi:hypothetical protein